MYETINESYINGQKTQALNQYNDLNDYEKEEFLSTARDDENIDILYFIAYRNI